MRRLQALHRLAHASRMTTDVIVTTIDAVLQRSSRLPSVTCPHGGGRGRLGSGLEVLDANRAPRRVPPRGGTASPRTSISWSRNVRGHRRVTRWREGVRLGPSRLAPAPLV